MADAKYTPTHPKGLSLHLVAFRAQMDVRGLAEKHKRDTVRILERFASDRGLELLEQITYDEVIAWFASEQRRGIRARGINKRREALNNLANWAVKTRRLEFNPLSAVPKLNQAADRVFVRRAHSPDQLRLLLRAVPLLRRAVYQTAVTTGLRRSELRAVLLEHVCWEEAAIVLPARFAKNRKEARVHLQPETAEVLRKLQANRRDAVREARVLKSGDDRPDHLFPAIPGCDTLYRDLERVGTPRETPRGRIDFHAFRATFATLLQLSGAPLALTAELMRHSDPILTTRFYTCMGDAQRAEAVDSMWRLVAA